MLRRGCNARFLWILLLMGGFTAIPTHAQDASMPVPPQQQHGTPDFGPPLDRDQQKMLRKMAQERNVDRQKEIVADTDKLVELAKKLQDEVKKSNKDQLSLSVVDTADQIEKLAKSVKERMKNGT